MKQITLSLNRFKDLLGQAYDNGFDDGAFSEYAIKFDDDKERNDALNFIVNRAIDLHGISQLRG